jgi:hypothetical protein
MTGRGDRDLALDAGCTGGSSTRARALRSLMRRSARWTPRAWVDGIRLLRDTDLSAWFMPGSVEGIEIYPNASFVPPELAGGESCGAIAIWSRAERGNPFTIKRIAAATAITLVGILITR